MFDIPRELIEDIVDGKVTLFIGAGLSVEAGVPNWDALIRPLARRLGIPEDQPLNHLEVIDEYVATRSVGRLITHVRDQTDTTDKSPADNHGRLARLGIRNWITTNYDDLLEKTLELSGQRYNLVYKDTALPFIRPDEVTLYQLHGMRKDPESMVITRERYNLWPTNNPGVYSELLSLLTKTTLLFVGYSLRDPDFGLARDRVSSMLGNLMPPSYGFFFDLRTGQVDELKQRNVIALNLPLHKYAEPSIILGIWLEDLIRQVDLERNRRPGKGKLPPAVVEFYATDPPTRQDQATKLKQIKETILSSHAGKFLEIWGETGRGKSRLLYEAIADVVSSHPQALLIYLNLETLIDSEPEQRPLSAIRGIIDAADGRLAGESFDPDVLAALALAQLRGHKEEGKPVCLIFDTTEALQADSKFWRWLEHHLVTPILDETEVALLFAGRTLIRWSGKNRAQRATMYLETLESGQAFQRLTQDVLIRRNTNHLNAAQWRAAQQLVLQLSSQHPGLCVQMSTYLAQNGISDEHDKAKAILGREVLKPFVDDVLFAGKDQKSRNILTLTSVLDWYDSYVLHDFLEKADPSAEYSLYELERALNTDSLTGRSGDRTSYRSGGFQPSSVLKTIVQQTFELNEPDRYRQALAAKESIGATLSMEEER